MAFLFFSNWTNVKVFWGDAIHEKAIEKGRSESGVVKWKKWAERSYY